ncbi:unnamed protein product [Nesidiocoris tenuis]|uniref:Uncharacterized protein n=1 Tax=Nesidiocoris tenuis TaxID=355587 RepID=A0A6H5GYL2_9HEMI|nr:unnamed protein product [Nesidiocoris tenuis]
MTTLLCDCEAVINSRPLTSVSQDTEDLTPLTPNMFLMDSEEVGSPDLDRIEATDLKSRVRYRQWLKMNLQNRFRSEYLVQLKLFASQQKTKPPILGAIVLIRMVIQRESMAIGSYCRTHTWERWTCTSCTSQDCERRTGLSGLENLFPGTRSRFGRTPHIGKSAAGIR